MLNLKKCSKCGALVEVLTNCKCNNCEFSCCNEKMIDVKANSVDASFEKHKPQVTIIGNFIEVVVPHVMEDNHYIEWIALVTNNTISKQHFKPGDTAKTKFHYHKGSKVYAYCNLHSLWETDVD